MRLSRRRTFFVFILFATAGPVVAQEAIVEEAAANACSAEDQNTCSEVLTGTSSSASSTSNHPQEEDELLRAELLKSRDGIRVGVRVFTDFDDTLYSSMGARHYSFAAGTDTRQGTNETHGRIYAGVGWLFHSIAYAHGGPAQALWNLLGAAAPLGLTAEAAEAEHELLSILGSRSGHGAVGRMDVVVVTARPSQKSARAADAQDDRAACFVDEGRQFGGYKHPSDRRVIEYFHEVAANASRGRDEGWGFAKSAGYTYLSTFLPQMIWNVLGGITNFVTTLDIDSPVNGTPSMLSDRRKTYQTIAASKADFILSWVWSHPEEDFMWFGDNGQGDLCTGGLLLKNLTSDPLRRLRGIYIHDMTKTANHARDPVWAGHRGELGIMEDALDQYDCGVNSTEFMAEVGHLVFIFDNYLQAAEMVKNQGVIDEAALKMVREGYATDRRNGLCCDDDIIDEA